MSLAGFKKQINKANQYVSEKIGGAKGTELDDDFMEMERKVDVTVKLVDDLISNTQCLLQPNPASRLKLNSQLTLSKFRGQAKNALYPQPEGVLGESMTEFSDKLGEESDFADCLREAGEAYKNLADVKYALEDEVKQNFLEPLHHLQTKDLKEVLYHRKKLSGRRLDFDCKRRKKEKAGGAVTEEEIQAAAEKFDESKQRAENAMINVLENDVEQISQLAAFIESQVSYHRQSMEILQSLSEKLEVKKEEAAAKPRPERPMRKVLSKRDLSPYDDGDSDFGSHMGVSPVPSPLHAPNAGLNSPCCRALYDFEPENEGELAFNEGEVIKLTQQIDENWYEGEIHGRSGFFPVSYVEVLVNLN